ncbi:hypothetical protein [Helicobacter pylori]|uniref:hypothetical protein n=1 Tax=Helicobacter pylori TaxID=210 RepID=UPI0026A86742|nr:hypothetical protein [Helicobacter pylori]
MAYIANLQFLPLDEILISNGYKHKVEKSSKNNPALYNENDTIKGTLIVSRKPDGSYHYFNHQKQKSQISLVFGMNATNSWYNIPIHSYLA